MKVSVLVPVYNLARFIEPCLLSLLEPFMVIILGQKAPN